MLKSFVILILGIVLLVGTAFAQVVSPIPSTAPVQMVPSYYATTPISVTNAVNVTTTLTIPAPPTGLYNYVCYLGLNISASNTGAVVISNGVTTSTNFNSFALKFSFVGTANTNYDWAVYWGNPATGCAKSVSPGTATTFVSPAPGAQNAATWYATYYQAP